jgi:hypothetical protein
MTPEQLLREAASEALLTLDGIADTNPRDKADFEDKDEWITWAKSRAKWAADKLRAPISRELHAERVLKQMLEQDAAALSHPAAAAKDAEGSGEVVAWRWRPSQVFPFWAYTDDPAKAAEAKKFMGDGGVQPLTIATTPASQPQADHLRDDAKMVAQALVPLPPTSVEAEFDRRNAELEAKGWGDDVPSDLMDFEIGARFGVEEFCRINGLEVKP